MLERGENLGDSATESLSCGRFPLDRNTLTNPRRPEVPVAIILDNGRSSLSNGGAGSMIGVTPPLLSQFFSCFSSSVLAKVANLPRALMRMGRRLSGGVHAAVV